MNNISIPLPSLSLQDICPLLLGSFLCLYVISFLYRHLFNFITYNTTSLQHIIQYRFLHPCQTTLYQLLIILAYCVFCFIFFVLGLKDNGCRWLLFTNLIVCMFTGHNPILRMLFTYETVHQLHITSASLSFITGAVHLTSSWSKLSEHSPAIIWGSIITLCALIVLAWLRSHAYEFFLINHKALSWSLAILASFHIGYRSKRNIAYNSCLIGSILCPSILRLCFKVYHYFSYSYCQINEINENEINKTENNENKHNPIGDIELSVVTRGGQYFSGGQYFFLTLPRHSLIQSHPVFPIWRTASSFYILIQPCHGFSKAIKEFPRETPMSVLLHGPYGRSVSLSDYGTLLLFATGIGISPIISRVQDIMKDYQSRAVKTQKIYLHWVIGKRVDANPAIKWINKLIQDDVTYVCMYANVELNR